MVFEATTKIDLRVPDDLLAAIDLRAATGTNRSAIIRSALEFAALPPPELARHLSEVLADEDELLGLAESVLSSGRGA